MSNSRHQMMNLPMCHPADKPSSLIRRLAVAAALLLCTFACPGQHRSQASYDEFHGRMAPVVAHTSWTARDGAPQNISAIAQSRDGFLWLGTPFGLFRFNGTDFNRYPTTALGSKLPSLDISALSADAAGGLWIGFTSGGISHLSADGTLKNYNIQNHLGPNSAQKFVLRPDGSVWAIADFKLYRLAGDHWDNVGASLGLPNDPLFCLFFDHAGTMWVSSRRTLFEAKAAQGRFQVFPTTTFMVVDMAETPDGTLWISDAWRTMRPLVPSAGHPGWPISGYVRVVMEHSGALWLATDYQGVTHMPWGATQTSVVKESEVSSEQANAIFLDRDGDVWVGTSRGLDRFRSTPLAKLSDVQVEYYPSLSSDPIRGVWIATLAHPLVYARGGEIKAVGHAVGSSPIICDDQGAVWMVDPIRNELTRWKDSVMTRLPIPPDVHEAPAESIGLDRDGALLISFKPNGLWRFDGRWTRVLDANLPLDEPLSIVRDDRKRVWFGYANSLIVEHDEAGYHLYPSGRNGELGNVLTFGVASGRLWAAGSNGLAYLEGESFKPVALARGANLSGISGIAQDKSGNLWANSSHGIVRIPREQLSNLEHTGSQLEYEIFDGREGVTGTASQLKPTPSAVADREGTMWFSTSGQVLAIDPQLLLPRKVIPSLAIERVSVNGVAIVDREHPMQSVVLKSSALKELQIDYVGIDMVAPEKINYRYRLEGEDKSWHEVGNRRQAFYTHLSPGQYHFRLAAASGGDVWTELPNPLLIRITPAFYQTYWFVAIVALLVMAVLYFAYILRVRFLTGSLKRRLMVRADERLRIARDLHDTLLQSIHGLMLRFHFATEELPPEEPARKSLQLALQRADDVFIEARRRIEFLRDEVPEEPNFALQLTTVAEDLDIQHSMQFRVVEEGQRLFLAGDVQSEFCRIAREALINSLNHAKASSAEIFISYGPSELSMKCSDDGVGIPEATLREGRRSGHWGLVGMKERAESIEAKFQIWSAPGAGTQIEVRVPGRRAYRDPISKLRLLARFRQFRRSATGQDSNS